MNILLDNAKSYSGEQWKNSDSTIVSEENCLLCLKQCTYMYIGSCYILQNKDICCFQEVLCCDTLLLLKNCKIIKEETFC